MRICVGCSQWSEASLCRSCRGELFVATPVRLGTGLEIFPAYRHSCTARRLVHRLKYAGIRQAGEILASAMVAAMPTDAAALVPVPRAMLRRARYGVDPAAVLAELVGREADIPVMDLLRAPLWWPANAGTTRIRRRSPRFHLVRAAPAGSLLVDDVATTGATLRSAATVSGLDRALTATRASKSVAG